MKLLHTLEEIKYFNRLKEQAIKLKKLSIEYDNIVIPSQIGKSDF